MARFLTKRFPFRWLGVLLFVWAGACTRGNGVPVLPTDTPLPDEVKIIPFFTTESDPIQLEILQELISEYQDAHPHVEVDIVLASPSSRARRLLTALASGADLGIFEIEPTLLSDWTEAGYLLPLDDVVEAIGRADFVSGSLYEQAGHVFAVPYAISVYGLWVREDLLAQAGLPLPQTYEELLKAAQVLTADNRFGIALPAGQNAASVNYFSVFLWQNGGDYFSCDGQVTFGEPVALESIRRWAALTQYAPPGYNTWSYGEQIDAFLNERVAMTMYGGRLGFQLAETHPEMAGQVTVIFPPFGEEKVALGVWSRFAIAASTRNQAEAKDFLQWLVSGDRLLRYDMTVPGHMIPPLASVREEAFESTDPFTSQHQDWIRAFYDWSVYTNHPAMNMGSVVDGAFTRSDTVPPWAWEVFGTPGIVDSMLQDIANGRKIEPAWLSAVEAMNQVVDGWKLSHPSWQGTCE